MRICLDIDGTLCQPGAGVNYVNARPEPEMIELVQRLNREGAHIILFTARGSGTGKDWGPLTTRQLWDWGVPYHELRFGKPYADLYVDDRAILPRDFLRRYGDEE